MTRPLSIVTALLACQVALVSAEATGEAVGGGQVEVLGVVRDGKLPSDLGQKADRYLGDRSEAFLKHWSDGRSQRDARLLALCAEAAKALGVR